MFLSVIVRLSLDYFTLILFRNVYIKSLLRYFRHSYDC